MKNTVITAIILSLIVAAATYGQDIMRRQEPTMKPVPTMQPMMKKPTPTPARKKKKKSRKADAKSLRLTK